LLISYNLLNLPTSIYGYGDYTDNYRYLSDGTKIERDYWDSQWYYEYRGSLVYGNNGFESASFGGGRIVGTNDSSEVHYFLTDHLGSTRVVAKVTPTGRVDLDRKDYYPFGKAWTQSDMPMSDNRYTFSGKEMTNIVVDDNLATIPIHDFGARNYDPDGVLFLQQDPQQTDFYSIGQHVYCAGNPVKYIDPDGNHPVVIGIAVMVKAAIGAGVDIAAQIAASQLNGNNWSESIQQIDWTSVGSSAAAAALTVPGASTGAKILAGVLEGINVAVDYTQANGLEYIGKDKSVGAAAIDALAPVGANFTADAVVQVFSKSITAELTSKSAATLSKAVKNEMKQYLEIINNSKTKYANEQFWSFSFGIEASILQNVIEPENTVKNGTTIQEDHKND